MGRLCLMFSVNHGDLARMPKGEAGAFLLRVVSRLEAGPSLAYSLGGCRLMQARQRGGWNRAPIGERRRKQEAYPLKDEGTGLFQRIKCSATDSILSFGAPLVHLTV